MISFIGNPTKGKMVVVEKQISGCLEPVVRGGGRLPKDMSKLYRMRELFCILTVVVVI